LTLVGFGTLAMIIALWNFRSTRVYLDSLSTRLQIPKALQRRWFVSYAAADVIMVMGLATFIFMVRTI
jgi:hypothetical protein